MVDAYMGLDLIHGVGTGVSNPFDGLIDEIRISTVVRSDVWLKATYRNLAAANDLLLLRR